MNNRGIARVIEATVAVLVIFSVLFILSSQSVGNDAPSLNSEITPLLEEISKDETLRTLIIDSPNQSEVEIRTFLEETITRPDLGYAVKVCGASEICALTPFPETRDGNVYSEERIISTYLGNNLDSLEFKKVKIFLWRK